MKTTPTVQSARSLITKTIRQFIPIQAAVTPTADPGTFDTCQINVRFAGHRLKLTVRTGTTDIDLIQQILHRDSMYRLPGTVRPQTIFDVGGNIGITTVYYAAVYPDAQLYCFEPLPDNLALLRDNVACFGDRVRVLPYGLSDQSGNFAYFRSNNPRSFGGGGFSQIGHNPAHKTMLPLVSVPDALRDLGIDRIDVFKVDTEGSELPILQSIPDEVRSNAQAILGELHGIGDWHCCQLLSQSHAVGIDKRYDRECFPFLAVRKDLAAPHAANKSAA